MIISDIKYGNNKMIIVIKLNCYKDKNRFIQNYRQERTTTKKKMKFQNKNFNKFFFFFF